MIELGLSSEDLSKIGEDILLRGECLRFRAPGRSMLPLVQDGQVLVVAPAHVRELRIGDVVFYRTEAGRAVAHRLMKKSPACEGMFVLTKGDSSLDMDPPIYPDQVLGKVVAIEQEDGQVIHLDSGINLMRMRFRGVLGLVRNRLPVCVQRRLRFSRLFRYLLQPS